MARLFPTLVIACSFAVLATAAGARTELRPEGANGSASEELLGLDETWACGKRMHISRASAREILRGGSLWSIPALNSRSALVVAELPPPMLGTAAFLRDGARWTPYYLTAGSTVQAIRGARHGALVYVVSLWSREGGGDLDVVRFDWRTQRFSCRTLVMPRDLNRPAYNGEFAEFLRLEMDGHGRGRLIARAALNRTGAARQRLYAYATRDGGRTWSDPIRLSTLPRPQAEVLSRIATRRADAAGIANALQSPPR